MRATLRFVTWADQRRVFPRRVPLGGFFGLVFTVVEVGLQRRTLNVQRPIQIAERWMLDVGRWAFSSASKESDNCACRWNIITPLRPCA